MILLTEKDYKDAFESLEALTLLPDEERIHYEDDIDLLVNAIVEYENVQEHIAEHPSWSVVEYHIYDRLGTRLEKLPLTNEERELLMSCMRGRENVPSSLLERVVRLSIKDLLP